MLQLQQNPGVLMSHWSPTASGCSRPKDKIQPTDSKGQTHRGLEKLCIKTLLSPSTGV